MSWCFVWFFLPSFLRDVIYANIDKTSLDSKFKPNDAALLIDRKGRRYLKILRPGIKLLIRGELDGR